MLSPSAPASPETILAVSNLTHRFGGLLAVSNVDLAIPRGGVLALIGPNGAGKSTTVNLLTGVIAPNGILMRCMPGASHMVLGPLVKLPEGYATFWTFLPSCRWPLS